MNFTDRIGTTDPAVIIGPQRARQLICGYINTTLFGVLSVQVFIFYCAFPCEALYLKLLVYGVYVLETVQTALFVEHAFRMYVVSFGIIEGSNIVGTSWFSVPILTSVGTCAIQFFYAHRVYILSRRKALIVVILVLALIQLSFGIATGVLAHRSKIFIPITFMLQLATVIWNATSALCDWIITVSIIYYLSRTRSPIKETRRLVRQLIQLSLETGLLTSALSIVALLFMLLPSNKLGPAYEGVAVILGKVYANSMLVLVNRRARITSDDRELQEFGGGTTRISFRMADVENGIRTKPPEGGFAAGESSSSSVGYGHMGSGDFLMPMHMGANQKEWKQQVRHNKRLYTLHRVISHERLAYLARSGRIWC
ncbi:unnamed protein product [Cyclocybe aegerita]|uniref:DUF6534 domain-containing protein n=1 Tax=Cyclocybe aegerita TaxID=1973307 RepID=A0A8S0XFG3_CYCAE|nr:unnamed protein product [Cyclocybe aegerita]